ncbi:MAG: CBS domain-containing protein [Actinomycetota bacterium]|nr:CBS domain-containing protein [Actinomycetota bacterium]
MGFGEVYDYVAGKVDWFGAGLPGEGQAAELTRIGALVDSEVPTCAMQDRAKEVRDRLGRDDVCIVVNGERVVLGLVQGEDLDGDGNPSSVDDRLVSELMQEGPTTMRPNVPAAMLAGQIDDGSFPWLVVTDQDGILIGILRGSDLESWAEGEGKEQIATIHEGHDHG